MICDAVAAWVVNLSTVIAVQLVLALLGAQSAVRDGAAAAVASAVTIAVWLVVTLATGRTIGDHAVQLRFTGGELPVGLARFLRFLGGIGGYLVLAALPGAWGLVEVVFVLASVLLVFTRLGPRGLPGVVSGQRLVDARELPGPLAAE
jgi:hypothetical protein